MVAEAHELGEVGYKLRRTAPTRQRRRGTIARPEEAQVGSFVPMHLANYGTATVELLHVSQFGRKSFSASSELTNGG